MTSHVQLKGASGGAPSGGGQRPPAAARPGGTRARAEALAKLTKVTTGRTETGQITHQQPKLKDCLAAGGDANHLDDWLRTICPMDSADEESSDDAPEVNAVGKKNKKR